VRRLATIWIALALGACTQPEPYDEDVAYCRRVATPPSSTAFADNTGFFGGGPSSRAVQQELATGASDGHFWDCMRARFHERFPGVRYPLDP